MQIKKTIKYLIMVSICLIVGKIIVKEVFDNRPFKFEKYKTEEQLEKGAIKQFPVGSDLTQVVKDLEKSGAYCHSYIPYDKTDRSINVDCEYMTSLFSLYPIEDYELWLYGNKNNKLDHLGARRVSGFMLIVP